MKLTSKELSIMFNLYDNITGSSNNEETNLEKLGLICITNKVNDSDYYFIITKKGDNFIKDLLKYINK